MAKSKRQTPARTSTCDKCKTTAQAIPGTFHRRCTGQEGQGIKPKYTSYSRSGKWA